MGSEPQSLVGIRRSIVSVIGYGRETRETMDTARTLEETVAACLRNLPMRGAAE